MMSDWVEVAVLTGTKTLDGRLVVRSAPGLPFLLSCGQEVFFVPPMIDVPRRAVVEEIREGAGGDYIVRFSSVRDKTTAGKLLDCHVLLKRDDLDMASAALVSSSFISYGVFDVNMGYLGSVDAFDRMPAQFLLHVSSDQGKSFSIPFVDEFIVGVDPEKKTIAVDIPSGLLDL